MKRNFIASLSLSLLMSLGTVSAYGQNNTIKGNVVDENGEPIIGASVIIAGKNGQGTVTDFDGNYTISVPKGAKVTVSYIGYISQTVTPGGKVQLKEDSQSLEELVVVGYGTQKKAHLTGSVSQVSQTEIQDISTGNVATALSGLVNGVNINSSDSRPGSEATIYVRGADAMSAIGGSAQQPLYVIDGFILDANAFGNLDPSSIESISVLKDASAAVYGSRAANGVILVTTKKGKLGAPQISYSGTFGFTGAVSKPKMLNTYDFGRLVNIVNKANITDLDFNDRYQLFQADELEAMKGMNTDLLDNYWKTGFTHQHALNISGATDNANYFAGISYFNQDGNLGKLDYDRWNFRAGTEVKLGKAWKASLQVSGDYGKKDQPLMAVQSTSGNVDYMSLLTHPGYIPEYIGGRPMAVYGMSNKELATAQNYHYGYLQNSSDYKKNMSNNLYLSGSVEYNFNWLDALKGLSLKFSYSRSISNTKDNEMGTKFYLYRLNRGYGSGEHLYLPINGEEDLGDSNFLLAHNNSPIYNGADGGHISRTMSRSDRTQMNFTVNYARDFGQHSVNALFAIEKSENEWENVLGRGTYQYEFSTGQSNSIDVDAGGVMGSEFRRTEAGTLSYIGRANYSYANKYLLEALVRSDASTKFAPEHYWGFFPSVSAGWVISEEKFMQGAKWADFLKLRASIGMTGRDNIAAWQWMKVYNMDKDKGAIIGENNAAGSHIIIPNDNASVNRDLTWDKSTKLNVGVDWNTLNSRLGINIDAYYTWDREMLIKYKGTLPSTLGTTSQSQNVGEMNTYGIELSATWRDKIGENFKYKVNLQTGLSDNKVLFMDWATSDLFRAITYGSRTDMGSWGYQCLGMFRNFQDIEEYFDKNNISTYMGMTKDQVRPGMLIYKDVRGQLNEDGKTYGGPDGKIDSNDMVQLSKRSSNPYHMTFNLSAEYKDFSVSAQLGAEWGAYSFVPSTALTPNNAVNSGIEYLEYINMPSFWNPDNMYVYENIYDAEGRLLQAANHSASMPNLRFTNVNSVTSDFWRISGTRIKLSRLTIAYKLPKSICKPLGVNSVRFNLTGQNLLSLYNPYPDNFTDPMAGYGYYPALRKFTLGVNVSF